jgi:hypothetical protein
MQQEERSPDITLGNSGLICPIPYSEPLLVLLSVCLSCDAAGRRLGQANHASYVDSKATVVDASRQATELQAASSGKRRGGQITR